VDVEARYDEVLTAALAGHWVPERAVITYPLPTSAEGVSDIVKNAPLISSLPYRLRPWRLPSAVYLAQEVDAARCWIGELQNWDDEGERQLLLREAVSRLVDIEAAYDGLSGTKEVPTEIYLTRLAGVVEHYGSDQVVVVRAGTRVRSLQRELVKANQCLPMPFDGDKRVQFGRGGPALTVADAIGLNLPHALESQCGNWRDWIIGMTVVLADGTIAKSGSRAVKNVAGFDAHKLFVGARATLGIIVEVTLKTFPLASLPIHEGVSTSQPPTTSKEVPLRRKPLWIQRTRRSDFSEATRAAGSSLLESDGASSTLWAEVPNGKDLPRFEGDHVIRKGCGEKNLQITDPTLARLMQQAKAIFDPANKLNPGELGVV